MKIKMSRDHVLPRDSRVLSQGQTYDVSQALGGTLVHAGAAVEASKHSRNNTPQPAGDAKTKEK